MGHADALGGCHSAHDRLQAEIELTAPFQRGSARSEHTQPDDQSLLACSENSAVDRCPETAGVDGLCGKTRKMTGRENLDFTRRTSSRTVMVTIRRMGGPHAARSPARPNPCRIFLQGRLLPFKLIDAKNRVFPHNPSTPAVSFA